MATAYPMDKRMALVSLRQSGHSLRAISQQLQLSYDTVWRWTHRYEQAGVAGLRPAYAKCGNRVSATSYTIRRSAVWLKRLHPKWGAAYIRLLLQDRHPTSYIPSARQLQRYFGQAGLYRSRGTKPRVAKQWSKHPHDCWQVDAKEQLRLADGSPACWLSFTDECTGATLSAEPFPPPPH